MATAELTQTELRGEVIPRGSDGYDAARAGYQWYWRAGFVKELPDASIRRHIE